MGSMAATIWPIGLYKGCEDPYFAVISIARKREMGIVRQVLYGSDPRKIESFPSVLLHREVDISAFAKGARECGLKTELQCLAKMALEVVSRALVDENFKEEDIYIEPGQINYLKPFLRWFDDLVDKHYILETTLNANISS